MVGGGGGGEDLGPAVAAVLATYTMHTHGFYVAHVKSQTPVKHNVC